jgi:MFS family permease
LGSAVTQRLAASPATLILTARGIRSFGDGLISLVLPAYLLELGYGALATGMIATATLLGSAILTLLAGVSTGRAPVKTLLSGAAVLMTLTGVGFATIGNFWPLVLIAFVGTLNPSSGDVSVFLPLEQAELAGLVSKRDRTRQFARYSFIGSVMAAVGALAAGLPERTTDFFGIEPKFGLQGAFLVYAGLGLTVLTVYRGLPVTMDQGSSRQGPLLGQSRPIVLGLAALFSLDAFAGGFVVQSLLALWLFEKFDLSLATAGLIFFWTGVLSAFSYFIAARVADRFGLLNTMVFTHLPANVCLVLTAFAPSLGTAVALLLLRSALSQMDVPTRTSYVMSIVPKDERPAAASVTAVPRSLAAAVSPMLSGALLAISTFGWPLIFAGGLKIAYDLLLLLLYRKKPLIEDI